MKKSGPILGVLLCFFCTSGFSHTLVPIQKAKGKAMEEVLTSAKKLATDLNKRYGGDNQEGTVFNAYQITEIKPAQKKKESKDQLFRRIEKYSLHRDFSITGDDGGYDLQIVKNVKQLPESLPGVFGEGSDDVKAEEITDLVKKALDAGLLVLVGNGSGNNTMADILSVVDEKNKEYFYVMDSNFGSDN